jgi:hypothetical protein
VQDRATILRLVLVWEAHFSLLLTWGARPRCLLCRPSGAASELPLDGRCLQRVVCCQAARSHLCLVSSSFGFAWIHHAACGLRELIQLCCCLEVEPVAGAWDVCATCRARGQAQRQLLRHRNARSRLASIGWLRNVVCNSVAALPIVSVTWMALPETC